MRIEFVNKLVLIISGIIILLQLIALNAQIDRWNLLLGCMFSIVVSIMTFAPRLLESPDELTFALANCCVSLVDIIAQSVNLVALAMLSWTMNESCLANNRTIQTPYGVSCYDWRRYSSAAYATVSHKDRSSVVCIILGFVIIGRLLQTALLATSAHKLYLQQPRTTKSTSPQGYAQVPTTATVKTSNFGGDLTSTELSSPSPHQQQQQQQQPRPPSQSLPA